ncbi:MAG: glycosyltransferase [Caldithrix sp.]|nr:glycosyltransferase [Caldithrix sp.]
MAKSIVYVTIDPLEHRRRIFNQIDAAHTLGYEVTVYTIAQPGKNYTHESFDFEVKRIRVPFRGGPLKFMWFNAKVLGLMVFRSFDVAHLRGLWVLPGFLVYRLFHRPYLIYDAHEYFAGHQIWDDRPLKKRIWLFFERLGIPYIDQLITVSQPIAQLFKRRYPNLQRVEVVRNVPSIEHRVNQIPNDDLPFPPLNIVFHGYFLTGRALPQIMQVMDRLRDQPVHLTLIGQGPLENDLRKDVRHRKLEATITFQPMLPYTQLIQTISRYHVGLSLNEPDCLNRQYALGNKFFEYVMAGLPVIATDIETKRYYMDHYDIGVLVDKDHIVDGLTKALREILTHPDQWQQWRGNCRKAAMELNWELEVDKLKMIYEQAANLEKN